MWTLRWNIIIVSLAVLVIRLPYSSSGYLSVSEIQAKGKSLFRALRNSHSECNINCNGKKYRPVCGTDGVTYNHRCALKRAKRCDKAKVKVKRKGECLPSSKPTSNCLKERDDAVKIARKPTLGIFIPECKRDGTYSDVQCHSATGYCWCVTSDGKPIKGTSMQGKKPNCRGKPKRKQSRGKGKRRKKKRCKNTDRQQFNKNLVNVFKEEYNRASSSSSSTSHLNVPGRENDEVLNSLEKKVVEWKFSQLDKNNDNKLRRKETRTLKRMVKKLIKPRACAKTFLDYCDLDKNKKIERKEWSLCLGVDINSKIATTPPTMFPFPDGEDGHEQSTSPPTESSLTEEAEGSTFQFGNEAPIRIKGASTGLNPTRPKAPDTNPEKEDKTRSCVEERQAATKLHQQDPTGGTFIPRCTDTGKWSKAQCHESSGFCWCVNEENGIPVPGTSTHKVQPTCDFEADRDMKGCPYAKKRRFLSDLIDTLTKEMNVYVINGTDSSKMPDSSPDLSIQEKVVRWKFKYLDSNNNKNLERKEIKPFRKRLPSKKDTRKCSRNFLRYCDENNNRKITLEEWIDCMGIKNKALPLPQNPKRTGPNPFNKYLNPS